MKKLKETGGFQDTLLDREHMKAFDLILKVWEYEYDAMEKSGFAPVLSMMNLLATVHVKMQIKELIEKMRELEKVKSLKM